MDVESVRVRADDAEDLAAAQEAARQAEMQHDVVSLPQASDQFQPEFEPDLGDPDRRRRPRRRQVVVDWWERRQGGLVIDLRAEAEDNLYRDDAVPSGYVVTFTADGKVTIEVKGIPEDAQERLRGEIVSGAYSTVKDLADAAKKVAGPDKVKPEPATL